MRAWIQAARPLAHANIAPPLIVGQALAYAVTGRFDWGAAAAIHLFGVVDHLFIIFANDYADREADPLIDTHNLYSGGSRVLVEGKLTPRSLGRAAVAMAVSLVVAAAAVGLGASLPWAPALALLAVGLLWAYSFPPLRLSYRGGGELLQGLGVGVVLPLAGFYGQARSFDQAPWLALIPTLLMGVAANVLTALPDEPGDRRANKRTWPVVRGGVSARVTVVLTVAVALALLPATSPPIGWVASWSVVALPALLLLAAVPLLASADASRRARCLAFVTLCGGAMTTAQIGWSIALALAPQTTRPATTSSATTVAPRQIAWCR